MAGDLTGTDEASPHMRLQLFHESTNELLRRRPVSLTDIPDVPLSRTDNGQQQWLLQTTITEERRIALGEGTFVLFINEFDRFMPATYTDDFAEPVSFEDMGKKATLVESGARFSARIEVPRPK
jgi:hypothetical protein